MKVVDPKLYYIPWFVSLTLLYSPNLDETPVLPVSPMLASLLLFEDRHDKTTLYNTHVAKKVTKFMWTFIFVRIAIFSFFRGRRIQAIAKCKLVLVMFASNLYVYWITSLIHGQKLEWLGAVLIIRRNKQLSFSRENNSMLLKEHYVDYFFVKVQLNEWLLLQTNQKGSSIKYVCTFFAIFDTPLPHDSTFC